MTTAPLPLVSTRASLLMVDDDLLFSRVLSRALEARGFEVRVAHTGQEALRLARENPPEYAVLDLQLPDTTGLKLVQQLLALDPATKIVLLTAYASVATAIDGVKLGATYCLCKPADADQVVAAFDHRVAEPGTYVQAKPLSVDRVEWEYIQSVLSQHAGNVSSTARALNMHRRTLQRKLAKHPPRA